MAQALSLGISVLLSAFAFSPPISLDACIYTAVKPAGNLKSINIISVNPISLNFSILSMVGTIALGFLADNTAVQRNSAFYNVNSLWEAPISLKRPTATWRTSSTPTLPSPSCQVNKQILAAVAIASTLLVGSAYVAYLALQNSFSLSSEAPSRDYQRSAQQDRRRDPAPWPLPPLSRHHSRSEPPNRRPLGSNFTGGSPRKVNTHHNPPLRRPFREDPPPPPPPSLAGFIEDFPTPRNFEELIIMSVMLGALCGWILKKVVGYFFGRKASQRTGAVSLSLPRRATSSIASKTGDCSRPTPTRSRFPERRQTPHPLDTRRSVHPVSVFLIFPLAGSGTLALFGLKARRHATNVQHAPNPTVPLMVVPSRDHDSTFAYPVSHELDLADTSYRNRLPSSHTSPTLNSHRQSSITRRSPSAVRLAKIEQVKYFYKDEIIGFENGPRPRGRSASVS